VTTQAEQGAPPSRRGGDRGRAGRIVFYVGLALLAANIVTVLVLWLRLRHEERTTHEERVKDVEAGISVLVVRVETSSAARELTLPAEINAFSQTTVYAKISGYVREMRAERGDHVKEGQVLAVLQSPENERDVAAARSDSEAKEHTAERMRRLAGPGVVSQQDRENAERDARVARENLARALDVSRYTLLRAPFEGVVTARYADPGALLPAATGATQAAMPLVDLADLDRVRIFVYVGQDVAPFVRVGDGVKLWRDEKANEEIPAKVTRITGALDPRTRTMQCEIDLDNKTWALQPGTFVHAKLLLAVPPQPVIPNESLAVRDGHTIVAVVEQDRAHLVRVTLGLNDGRTTRVLHGLAGGEMVIVNVPVSVTEGSRVRVRQGAPRGDAGR
jgi:membrane fusion protein, multidrug efflux system